MAADGSKGPKPYEQRRASTVFVRVPTSDWVEVKSGHKTEFRGSPGAVSSLNWVETPTPVVAYRYSRAHGYDAALMVLEERWQEPLGAITPESLAREGHESFAHFRRYWIRREGKRFRPTREVVVYRIRRWAPEDARLFADRLLARLYGDFLPEEAVQEAALPQRT